MRDSDLQAWLQKTKILVPPKQTLATFGETQLHYILLSDVSDEAPSCRVREGHVLTEKPKILTMDSWRERFEGFGEHTAELSQSMERLFGDSFRSLEYRFKNHVSSTTLEHTPLPDILTRIASQLRAQDSKRTAVLQGPDEAWAFSLMKFAVEMSMRSFRTNVQELEERGLFDPTRTEETRQRRTIETLFRNAEKDRDALKRLGEYLKESGLFSAYEDRFFGLVGRLNA